MADNDKQISLLSEIKEEISQLNRAQTIEEADNDSLEVELKNLGRAYSAAIAAGDSQAQEQLKEARAAIKQQMNMNGYLAIAEEMRLKQEEKQEIAEEQRATISEKTAALDDGIKNSFGDALKNFLGRDFKEKFFDSFTRMSEGLKKFGSDAVGNLKGKAEDVGNFFLDIAKIIGGVIALQGFMDGLQKATEWFGPNATLGDKIASGLAGAVALFTGATEEETKALAESISETFTSIMNVVGKIKDVMVSIFGEKGAIAVTLFMVFGGALRNMLLKGVFVAAKTLITTVGSSLSTLLAPVMASMSTFFSGLIATLSPMLVAAAPFIAIGAAIAAGLTALYLAGKEALAVFEASGSFTEGLAAFVGKLIGLPFDLMKNLVSWIAEKLGFENFAAKLDSFSFGDMIADVVAGAFNFVKLKFMEMVNSITGWWNSFITGDSIIAKGLRKLPGFSVDEDYTPTYDIEAEKAKMAEERQRVEDFRVERVAENQRQELEESQKEMTDKQSDVNAGLATAGIPAMNQMMQANVTNNTANFAAPKPRPLMGFTGWGAGYGLAR